MASGVCFYLAYESLWLIACPTLTGQPHVLPSYRVRGTRGTAFSLCVCVEDGRIKRRQSSFSPDPCQPNQSSCCFRALFIDSRSRDEPADGIQYSQMHALCNLSKYVAQIDSYINGSPTHDSLPEHTTDLQGNQTVGSMWKRLLVGLKTRKASIKDLLTRGK